MSSLAAKANVGLNLSGKIAVIAGGTQGIGAATALRFAAAGASVYIIGRNATFGTNILDELYRSAKEPKKQRFEFIKADLSLVSGLKGVAKTLTAKSGARGVDHFITTAGKTPNGVHTLTSEGHDSQFAIQILGRFGLAYLLAKSGTIKESILFVCAPGGKSSSPPNVNDLELLEAAQKGKYGMISSAMQGAGVLDAVTYEFSNEFPSIRTMHTYPGAVDTNVLANSELPGAIVFLYRFFMPVIVRTIGNTASGYAEIPLYLSANEESRREELIFTNEKLADLRPKWIDQKPEVAKAVWDKMVAIMET